MYKYVEFLVYCENVKENVFLNARNLRGSSLQWTKAYGLTARIVYELYKSLELPSQIYAKKGVYIIQYWPCLRV
jgi:hypothetical protein